MRFSEDFSNIDAEFDIDTDDEENQAKDIWNSSDDGSSIEPEIVGCSRSPCSHDDDDDAADGVLDSAWPRSYRESMNIYANMSPTLDFLKGASFSGLSSSFFSLRQRKQSAEDEDDLPSSTQPLLSPSDFNKEAAASPASITRSRKSSFASWTTQEVISRSSQKKCSFSQTMMNSINILCGIGLLATPYAAKEGGWLSLSFLAIFGCVCCYTGILIKRCLESSPNLRTYPDIGQAAFGTVGRIGIAIVLYTELYAVSVEFIVMMGDNLASVFPDTTLEIVGFSLCSKQIFAILATLVMLPTVWLRDLSLLSYLSAGGVFTTLLVTFCLLWLGMVDKVGFQPSGTILDLTKLPVAIGMYAFCYCGHSTFPNIYSSMEKPSQFPLVLVISFIVCWILYTGVGAYAFLMFGSSTKSQFTLNMPTEYIATKIAVWTTIVSPVTKYALMITPIAMGLEELIPYNQSQSRIIPILMRSCVVISDLVIALTFQYFALIMSLIGSMLGTLITFIFPCACYLSIYRGRLSWVQITFCTSIMITGSVCMCIGTYSVIGISASEMS